MAPRSQSQKAKQVTEPVTIDFEEPPSKITTRIDKKTGIHFATCDLCGMG
jgi:hypothetical protein